MFVNEVSTIFPPPHLKKKTKFIVFFHFSASVQCRSEGTMYDVTTYKSTCLNATIARKKVSNDLYGIH